MKKVTPKVVIVFACLIVLIVGYYAYLSNKDRAEKEENKVSAVQETLSRDLRNDYPNTPKEVIKYYNEIIKCFYNEEWTDEELDDLGEKARELYDDELLEANELGTYMLRLRADIQDYKDKERRIASAAVAASTNVDYYEEDGYSFARIMCVYNITEGNQSNPTRIMYLLRKDDEKHWKIYGWEDAANLQEYQNDETAE